MPKTSSRPSRQAYNNYEGVLGKVIGQHSEKERNKAIRYIVRCIDCGETHLRNAKHLKQGTKPQECKFYKPPNWSGLDKQDNKIRKQYGISMRQFTDLLAEQGGGCAICEKPMEAIRRRMNIDHCHETNKVRGIICSGCNTGLGHLGDNIAGLQRAIAYLQNPPFKNSLAR